NNKQFKEELPYTESVHDALDEIQTFIGDKPKKRVQTNTKFSEDFSLLNLLQHENKRLSKLSDFFNEKLSMQYKYPLYKELILNEEKKIQAMEKTLTKKLVEDSCTLQKNLADLFNHSFFLETIDRD